MLHNSFERFLWRLLRFGAVANRPKVTEWIANRHIRVEQVNCVDGQDLIDEQIEIWWQGLDRSSIIEKWDKLICLFGYPTNLSRPPDWHFDKAMLEEFDGVRHNAVHHDAQEVKEFNFDLFAAQLSRATFVLLPHIGIAMGLHIDPENAFSLPE